MSLPFQCRSIAIGIVFLCCAQAAAKEKTFTIDSDPPGATVEINGRTVGKTPYTIKVDDAVFNGTRWVWGVKHLLREQVHVRLLMEGYLPVDQDLASGPFHWIANNGVYHGDYWLIKTPEYKVRLQKADTKFSGPIEIASQTPAAVQMTSLSTEEIFKRATPAVIVLQSTAGSGSGFLVTDDGVAVTNAHVVRGNSLLTANTYTGQNFLAKVIYIDPSLDLALVRVQGQGFPHLSIADLTTIQPGSSVVAIGTPSKGLQNSLTRGVVSAVGPIPKEPGTWIQTDTAINPGNSGGPLLNSSGEVVGITTQKEFVSLDGRPLQGIGFALSTQDLISVLKKFDATLRLVGPTSPQVQQLGTGRVAISADVSGADVFVDGDFVGNTPCTLKLSAGKHQVTVKTGSDSWDRNVLVMEGSDLTLSAILTHKASSSR